MPIAASMLPEFDHEMKTTRTLLERIPESKSSWKPHPKSMSMGELAMHIPGLVGWMPMTIAQTEFNVNPPGGQTRVSPRFSTTEALLALFGSAVIEARSALAGASDETMMAPWSLKNGTSTIFTMPRVGVVRTMILNHIVHHRGQLSVYLRLNDIPVPEIYGPTADSVR